MTLGELVRVLTDARSFDSEFRSVFFLTLLSFATPMEVLNLLRFYFFDKILICWVFTDPLLGRDTMQPNKTFLLSW